MILFIGKLRRGGSIFVCWVGDLAPRHVHIYDGKGLAAKFDLDEWKLMEGKINKKILRCLFALRSEGKL